MMKINTSHPSKRIHLHEYEGHEEVSCGAEEELSAREILDSGVVDSGVERKTDHGHNAVQCSHDGRHLACPAT